MKVVYQILLGVLFFNFLVLNDVINLETVGNFGLQILIMLVISFIATAFLAFLLSRIDHHVKFAPIVLLIILNLCSFRNLSFTSFDFYYDFWFNYG